MDTLFPSDDPVAVVVPAYKSPDLLEAFVLQRNATLLEGFPLYLLCPESLDIAEYEKLVAGIIPVRVRDDEMSTWRAYSSLLCSPDFYRSFERFRYLLILQLDGLVLDASALAAWLDQGYDYVGPPWFSRGAGLRNKPPTPKKNGIGGVSLRKVDAFTHITSGERRPRKLPRPPDCSLYRNPKWRCSCMIRGPHFWSQVRDQARQGSLIEDEFWAFHVPRWFAWSMPSPYQSLHFAFHFYPSLSYEILGAPPFAVHGRDNIEAIYAVMESGRATVHSDDGSRTSDPWGAIIGSVGDRSPKL